MPTFGYQAVDGGGKRTRGVTTAASAAALTRTLEERGLLVLTVAECAALVFIYRYALSLQGELLQAREKQILDVVTSRAA